MVRYKIELGDCLEVMKKIKDKSIHAVLVDPPYGTTKCKWDTMIPLDRMWLEIDRIIKPGAAVVIFCTQPFTSVLIGSNLSKFKYCWTWDKKIGKGHLVAKHRPLQQTEDIAVFGKGKIIYYPILIPREKPRKLKEYYRTEMMAGKEFETNYERVTDFYYPKTLLHFPWSPSKTLHPTEKPVALLEYLVKTYTAENNWILDFTMGSGSTGVAALNLKRRFIGVEKEEKYFEIAEKRLENAKTNSEMGHQ